MRLIGTILSSGTPSPVAIHKTQSQRSPHKPLQGINPEILPLDNTVVAPTGKEPAHVVTVSVSFEGYIAVHYQVDILPDGAKIKVKH